MIVKNKGRLLDVAVDLNSKIEQLTSYLPKHLQDDFKKEAYIAGGAIYSSYNFLIPKDYDVFIKSEELKIKLLEFFKTCSNDLKLKYVNGKLAYYGTYLYNGLFITDNAISIGEFQIILKDIGEPEEVVAKFDFKHNMHYVSDGKVNAVDNDYNLDTNELYFNEKRARDIVSTIMRTTKFIKRGFTLSDKELAKMLLQLSESGFSDEEILLLVNKPTSTSFGSGQ